VFASVELGKSAHYGRRIPHHPRAIIGQPGQAARDCNTRANSPGCKRSCDENPAESPRPALFGHFGHQLLLAFGQFLTDGFGIHSGGSEFREQLFLLFLNVPLYHFFEHSDPGVE
jgi:hypothetical protein